MQTLRDRSDEALEKNNGMLLRQNEKTRKIFAFFIVSDCRLRLAHYKFVHDTDKMRVTCQNKEFDVFHKHCLKNTAFLKAENPVQNSASSFVDEDDESPKITPSLSEQWVHCWKEIDSPKPSHC